MPRSDRTWKRDEGSRIYTRRINLFVPAWFALALKQMATERNVSLSALTLPWIEAGQAGTLLADSDWGEMGELRQITLRIPKKLYEVIRGERGNLPHKLAAGWVLAGWRNKTAQSNQD